MNLRPSDDVQFWHPVYYEFPAEVYQTNSDDTEKFEVDY